MKFITVIFLHVLFLNGLLSNVISQEVLQWRGVGRSGYFPTEHPLKVWPAEGPELILHVDSLPDTYSSVIVKDDVMFTTGVSDTSEYLSSITSGGIVLWDTYYGKPWYKSYNHARCTPTILDDKAYVISGYGHIACIDIYSGNVVWGFDAYTKFGGVCGKWGVAESPLVVDDKVIYTPCGELTTMVAVDRFTGETIWKSESLNEISSYCSPILFQEGDERFVITVTSNYVLAVDVKNGEISWKYNYSDQDMPFMGGDINPVTPLVNGREVFITSGYNHVGIMLQIADDLKSVSVKWINEDMDVHHGGVVYHDGYIYGSNYTSIRDGDWMCLDWETGAIKYQAEWHNKGQIIATDDYFIVYDERRGNVGLLKNDPEKFDIVSSFKVELGNGPHWSHPTIYQNKLFLRHGESLLVYQL